MQKKVVVPAQSLHANTFSDALPPHLPLTVEERVVGLLSVVVGGVGQVVSTLGCTGRGGGAGMQWR